MPRKVLTPNVYHLLGAATDIWAASLIAVICSSLNRFFCRWLFAFEESSSLKLMLRKTRLRSPSCNTANPPTATCRKHGGAFVTSRIICETRLTALEHVWATPRRGLCRPPSRTIFLVDFPGCATALRPATLAASWVAKRHGAPPRGATSNRGSRCASRQ